MHVAARELGIPADSVAALVYAHGFRWNSDGVWTRLRPGDADPETGSTYRGPVQEARLAQGERIVVDEAGMLDQDSALAVELPSLRPDAPPIRILGYPIETVLAEKLVTAIELGRANTRVRDFAVIHLLTGTQALQCGELRDALTATANFRGTTLIPLAQATEGLAVLRNSTYVAYRKGLGEAGANLPEQFSDTVAAVADFVDPVLDGLDAEAVWSPAERSWSTAPVTPSEPTETGPGRTGL